MKQRLVRAARRLAPSTIDGLHDVDLTRREFGELSDTLRGLRAENADLRERLGELEAEIDELRRDAPRIAELYDLVFERLDGSSASG